MHLAAGLCWDEWRVSNAVSASDDGKARNKVGSVRIIPDLIWPPVSLLRQLNIVQHTDYRRSSR